MIRERRNKDKLASYYKKFMEDGVVDPNVHPWVAESWQRCAARKLPHETMPKLNKLSKEEIVEHQKLHEFVVQYVDGLYEQNKQHFNVHNLSMLLIDEEGYVIKNYALPFFQRIIEDIQGMRVLEEDVGTSSISVAREHKVPFLMFGPEMWIKDSHSGDACSAPVLVNGKIRYIISFFSLDQNDLPYDMILSLLLTMKYSIEQHLQMLEYWNIYQMTMNELPVSVYWVGPDEQIKYCNENGVNRLEGKEKLEDIFLNYEHIPIKKALKGLPTHRREITWITQDRTYEDITTVLPVKAGNEVDGALVLTMSIEDLKTTIAHATGYSSRYSLYSMVGETNEFLALQHKASRIARSDNNILIQGEPGTGKQRLAHGIHQASPRAAAPLIVVKCYNGPSEELEEEFFGAIDHDNQPTAGKLELSLGGTLFLDEVEKLSVDIGDKLADALKNGILNRETGARKKLNIRVIAACDSNLKRLADKGLFSKALYELVLNTVIRVPPLRERVKDIEVIAAHILAEMSAQHSLPPKKLSPRALQLLTSCSWTGNIKQLQGVIEQAFFHTPGGVIEADNIKLPSDRTMEKSWKYDKDAFIAAWKSAGGNISKLAGMLDVSRVTLYRYLKKYGLGPKAKE
ncbi:MAG TPA: sigma-54-dependent Fis family transcriptional regulator [Candidatus Avacidaminococcus intestinavium]|uniref:Sigma-54-dependent Fis family transcriptional regulator n=1 Tax=Candidatus Avacidaminococcus intestinavium TaxID=2840684 RepID=A0A9D1MRN7_9FIRM|nr:sigma-54-dependent Fis family transcriptional regulator [Candidatus Avacidaminococcus intestinavium]